MSWQAESSPAHGAHAVAPQARLGSGRHMPKRFFLCLGVPGSDLPLGVDEPETEPAPGVAPPGVDAGVWSWPDAPMGVMPRDWRAPG